MLRLVNQPPEIPPKVTAIWAFLAIGPNGEESLLAAKVDAAGAVLPFIASNEVMYAALLETCKRFSSRSDMKIKVAKFTNREDLQVIYKGVTLL